MNKSRITYQRMLACLLLVLIFCSVLIVVNNLLKYFKRSEPSKNLFIEVSNQFDHHHPQVKWLEDAKDIGGEINPYLRKEIEQAYLDAWAVSNLYSITKESSGLPEHFTDPLVEKITQPTNSDLAFQIEKSDLNHELQLKFISLDKQVVSFKDSNVRLLSKIETHNSPIIMDEIFEYSVLMILSDGRWKIDKLVCETQSETADAEGWQINVDTDNINGINYYPQKHPWTKFWTHYSPETTSTDLEIISQLGFNSVRIFIPYHNFGGPHIPARNLETLDGFLENCAQNDLKAIITLFDFPVGFELIKYSGYDRHMNILFDRYKDNETILAWDLKNEPDLDFEVHGKEKVIRWLDFISTQAKKYNSSQAITIGWANIENASILADKLDFVSFHNYDKPQELNQKINELRLKLNDSKLLLSEYGMNTYKGLWPGGHSEKQQREYIFAVQEIINKNKIGGMLWTLYDWDEAPSEVFGWKPWIKAQQTNYGIVKTDGSYKPSAEQIKK